MIVFTTFHLDSISWNFLRDTRRRSVLMGHHLWYRNVMRPLCRCWSHVRCLRITMGGLLTQSDNDSAGVDVFLGDFSVAEKPSSVADIVYIFTVFA
eukprot:EC718810.1.p1 GENE.EC718810.1~~EC718810.1.p1  ORF type:complete len:96 (+),score=1.32 EC718810.1:77-364(+)